MTVCGIPAVSQLPRGQPGALEQRPRLVDPNVRQQVALPRGEQRADGAAVSAGREAAGVAVGERTRPGLEQPGGVAGHAPAALDLVGVNRPRVLRRRVVAHLVECPAEVDRSRPRRAKHALGLGPGPPHARPRARSRTPPRSRSRERRARPSSGSPRPPRRPSGIRPRPRRAEASAGRGRRRGRPRGAGSARAPAWRESRPAGIPARHGKDRASQGDVVLPPASAARRPGRAGTGAR